MPDHATAPGGTTPAQQPVAVIGMSCRLPGAADPEEFWALLRDGRDAVGLPSARRQALGAPAVPGGYLDAVDEFDAELFRIPPVEAAAMDPQQRLSLELVWAALEDAGIPPTGLRGSGTAVVVGVMADDYATLTLHRDSRPLSRYAMTGLHRSMLANRASYVLGLRGPSLTIDCGQSSSAVAVHVACESLRRGESTLAVAGGVNLVLAAVSTALARGLGALSPSGRCRTFDAAADGFVRGEGGGFVVLKLLATALADGDPVHCVIRGTAVNNDGGGAALTVPDRRAQEDVVRSAWRRAGVDPTLVQYVELHGTGTRVGDPVEAAALGAALGAGRPAADPLLVGSVKTNLGHLEGAAGIAGLLKVALALRHRELPASLHFTAANPEIPLDPLALRVQRELCRWPDRDGALLAGVSSFGMGGTNCHLAVSAAPDRTAPDAHRDPVATRAGGPMVDPVAVAWPLSAASPSGLAGQARRLAAHVRARPDLRPADVAHSLAATRALLPHRAVVVGRDEAELTAGLDELAAGIPGPAAIGTAVADPGRTVLVFPGQGAQWPAMGARLMDQSPAFRDRVLACSEAFGPYLGWSVAEVLRGTPGAPVLHGSAVVQPALFTMMVGLAAVWEELGTRPAAVVGHSQGEIAAAHVAGLLSLADAAAVVALRVRALEALAGTGGMVSTALPLADARAVVAGDGRLEVAAVNGPASTVLAGPIEAVEALAATLDAQRVRHRRLPVDYPSHTAGMDRIRDRLLDLLSGIRPRRGEIALYSTVTGHPVPGTALTPAYWFDNLRRTVRFDRAVTAVAEAGHEVFVEVSPHPSLIASIRDTLDAAPGGRDPIVVGSLRRDDGGWDRVLRSAAALHVQGPAVSWPAPHSAHRVPLPTYAFDRRRYWLAGAGEVGAEPAVGSDSGGERAAGTGTEVRPDAGFEPAGWAAARPERAGSAAARPERAGSAAAGPAAADGRDQRGRSLAARLAGLRRDEQQDLLLSLVRATAATVLGHRRADAVVADRAFADSGFDSTAGVELRDRLAAVTGLRLPSSLLYDFPTPAAVAEHLRQRLLDLPAAGGATAPAPATGEPVAIVGMGCAFPGGVRSPEDLWRVLSTGMDVVGAVPAGRGWAAGPVAGGGFLADAAGFDAGFFGISPREALAMDPQQRVLLEVTWEAVERAGMDPASLRGTRTGVFVGITAQEYGPRWQQAPEEVRGYLLTGTTPSVAAGRLAYVLGLHGPAVAVDTACSSSLVAVHQACGSLRSGECGLALAGGVTVMASPGIFTEFARQQGLAADGRCKPFAAAADGTGWSEGAGVVVLERLSDARRNGHRVLAVIRGSAVNSDGASNGLTAPSGAAQRRVIRQALANAGLAGADVDAVEAHGTGTVLGDPIEAGGLAAAYSPRPAERPLHVGSVKSNIGHTQAAAGVAGLLKTVLAMRHGGLPATLHVDAPTPHVDWDGPLRLTTEATPWPRTGRPRRAGVSSFGISGTNAHVILEEPEPEAVVAPAAGPARLVPVPLSARSPAALRAQAGRLHDHLAGAGRDLPVAEVARAAATTRTAFGHRAVVLATDTDELRAGLAALAAGDPAPNVVTGTADAGPALPAGPAQAGPDDGTADGSVGGAREEPADRTDRRPVTRSAADPVVLLFSGQGSQHPAAGRALHGAYPVFAAALDEACEHLDTALRRSPGPGPAGDGSDRGGWTPVRDVLFADPGTPTAALLEHTLYVQAVLFAFHTGLYRLLRAFGVTPSYLVGHSLGEISAAHAAGILSLPDAATLVAARGRLMHASPPGAMVSVEATEEEVRAVLAEQPGQADVAAVNGPMATVVSGDEPTITAVAGAWAGRGRRTTRLATRHAFHSAAMDPVLADFRAVAAALSYRPPAVTLVSALTGTPVPPAGGGSYDWPVHWTRHLREPVRFEAAVRYVTGQHPRPTFLELAPRPALTPLLHARQAPAAGTNAGMRTPDPAARALTTHHPPQPETRTLLTALARLHTSSVAPLSWGPIHAPATTPPTPPAELPTYPFQHQHYWLATTPTAGSMPTAPDTHALLGTPLPLADPSRRWFGGSLSATSPWYVAQHRLLDTPVLPGTAMTEWLLAAARAATGGEAAGWTLRGVSFIEVLPFPDDRVVAVQASVETEQAGSRVRCFGRGPGQPEHRWTEHASAAAVEATVPPPPAPVDLDGLRARLTRQPAEALYYHLGQLGLHYGPAFRAVRELWCDDEEAVTLIDTGPLRDADSYVLHPVVLDAGWHVVAAFLGMGGNRMCLPAAVDRLVVRDRLPARVWCRARWRGVAANGDCALDIELLGESGEQLVAIDGLRLRSLSRTAFAELGGAPLRRYELDWRPLPPTPPAPAAPTGTWLVCSPDAGLAGRWRAQLATAGAQTVAASAAGGAAEDGPGLVTVDLDSAADVRRLVAGLRAGLAGVVLHCAPAPPAVGTGGVPGGDDLLEDAYRQVGTGAVSGGDDLLEDAYRTLRRGWLVLREVLSTSAAASARIVVCSSGAAAARAGDVPDLSQAMLGGLVRAVVAEYPDVHCAQVDLDPAAPPPPLPLLLDRVAGLAGAGHLALRDGAWYEARLRAEDLSSSARPVRIRPDATYLVTGGLGGLATAVVTWLVSQGARSLVLLARSVPAEEPARLRALRRSGVRVDLRQGDVADPARLREVVADADRADAPLRGVVHTAGVAADGRLEELDWERFREVLDPKVRGGWHLHRATADRPLDFFLLFSSIASLVGTAGQANYVVANTFLDALASARRHGGLPATSVGWGPWRGTGMAERSGLLAELARAGLEPMTADQALDALAQVLPGPAPHVGLARIDWRRLLAGGARRRPYTLLADMTSADPADGEPAPHWRPEDLARLAAEQPEQAREAVLGMLLDGLAALLRLSPADRDALRPGFAGTRLNQLGLDSLTTVQLRNRLLADLSADVPAEQLLGGATAAEVAGLVCQQLVLRSMIAGAGEAGDDELTEVLTL